MEETIEPRPPSPPFKPFQPSIERINGPHSTLIEIRASPFAWIWWWAACPSRPSSKVPASLRDALGGDDAPNQGLCRCCAGGTARFLVPNPQVYGSEKIPVAPIIRWREFLPLRRAWSDEKQKVVERDLYLAAVQDLVIARCSAKSDTELPILIDTRPRRDYLESTIGDSINIPGGSKDDAVVTLLSLVPNGKLKTRCFVIHGRHSLDVLRQLRRLGWVNCWKTDVSEFSFKKPSSRTRSESPTYSY